MADIIKRIEELMDLFDEGEVTTADRIQRPQSALDRQMFEDFKKRNPMAYGGRTGFFKGKLVKTGIRKGQVVVKNIGKKLAGGGMGGDFDY